MYDSCTCNNYVTIVINCDLYIVPFIDVTAA